MQISGHRVDRFSRPHFHPHGESSGTTDRYSHHKTCSLASRFFLVLKHHSPGLSLHRALSSITTSQCHNEQQNHCFRKAETALGSCLQRVPIQEDQGEYGSIQRDKWDFLYEDTKRRQCDGGRPSCTSCHEAGQSCEYTSKEGNRK